MNSTVVRCKRETETKSGAHTWQRDCAHARLVTRDGEIAEEVGHGHVRHARLYGAAYVSVFSQSVAGNLKVTLLFSSLPKAHFKYNLNPVEPLGP